LHGSSINIQATIQYLYHISNIYFVLVYNW